MPSFNVNQESADVPRHEGTNRRDRPGEVEMKCTDLRRRPNGLRASAWAIVLGCSLLACATTHAPATDSNPPALVSPNDQPSDVQHPDARSAKRGVIVPSDVHMSGAAPPVPAATETASPGGAPTSGAGN
jgi:hypothetical protein